MLGPEVAPEHRLDHERREVAWGEKPAPRVVHLLHRDAGRRGEDTFFNREIERQPQDRALIRDGGPRGAGGASPGRVLIDALDRDRAGELPRPEKLLEVPEGIREPVG